MKTGLVRTKETPLDVPIAEADVEDFAVIKIVKITVIVIVIAIVIKIVIVIIILVAVQ